MGELYRNCDLDTVVNFLAKQVSYSCLEEEHKRPFDWPSSFQNVSKLTESNPKAMREELMQQCATILACYRLLVCFNRTMSSCNSSPQEKLRKPKQRWTVDPAWVHEVVAFVHQLSHEERRPLWRQVGPWSKPVMAFPPFFLPELTSLTFQWPRLWRPRVPHVNSLEHGRGQQPCLLLSQVDLRFCEPLHHYLFSRLIPLHTVNPEETGIPEQIR